MNTYDLGDLVTVRAVFKDPTEDPEVVQDPDTVSLSVTTPSGIVTTYVYNTDDEVVKDDTGMYSSEIDCEEAGFWHYRWWSSGVGQAAQEARFEVRSALGL